MIHIMNRDGEVQRATDLEQFKRRIQAAYDQIPQDEIQAAILAQLDRMQKVVDGGGAPFR